MERVDTDPDAFLASFLDPGERETMVALDEVIQASLPGRRRTLWRGVFWGGTEQSILGYGDIVQERQKGHDVEWFLVGLARQKTVFSLYVNAVENRRYLGQVYEDRIRGDRVAKSRVKVGSASIGIRSLADVDLNVLAEMLAQAHNQTPPDRRR